MKEIEKDDRIRVAIITGAGRAFCAGADLSYVKNLFESSQEILEFLKLAHRVHNFVENLGKPVIAALNGLTLAGGLELAMSCDIVVAAETARLGDQHANYGIIPGGGGSQRLPRIVGVKRAKEMLLTGNWITAAEGEKYGLVNHVVPPEKLMETAHEIADKLARVSPVASRNMKYLVNKGMQVDLYSGLEMEIGVAFQHFFSEDYREGITAFKEKRQPEFKGK